MRLSLFRGRRIALTVLLTASCWMLFACALNVSFGDNRPVPVADARLNPSSWKAPDLAGPYPSNVWFFRQTFAEVPDDGATYTPNVPTLMFGVISEWIHAPTGESLFLPNVAYSTGKWFLTRAEDEDGESGVLGNGGSQVGPYSPGINPWVQKDGPKSGKERAPRATGLQTLSEWSWATMDGHELSWHGAGDVHESAGLWHTLTPTCFAGPIAAELSRSLRSDSKRAMTVESTLPWFAFSSTTIERTNEAASTLAVGNHVVSWIRVGTGEPATFDVSMTINHATNPKYTFSGNGTLELTPITGIAAQVYLRVDGQEFVRTGKYDRANSGPSGNGLTMEMAIGSLCRRIESLGGRVPEKLPTIKHLAHHRSLDGRPDNLTVPLKSAVDSLLSNYHGVLSDLDLTDMAFLKQLPHYLSSPGALQGYGDSESQTMWVRPGLEWDLNLIAHELAHTLYTPPLPSSFSGSPEGLATWWCAEEVYVEAIARRILGWPLDFDRDIRHDMREGWAGRDLFLCTLQTAARIGVRSMDDVYKNPSSWSANSQRASSTANLLFGTPSDSTAELGAMSFIVAMMREMRRVPENVEVSVELILEIARAWRSEDLKEPGMVGKWDWTITLGAEGLSDTAVTLLKSFPMVASCDHRGDSQIYVVRIRPSKTASE